MDYWLNLRNVRRAIHAGQPESGAGVFYIGNARLTYNYDIFDIIPLHTSNIKAGEFRLSGLPLGSPRVILRPALTSVSINHCRGRGYHNLES